MSDEWTPLDDLGVEEERRRTVPERLSRAASRAAQSLERFVHLMDADRFLDTENDIKRVRELPEAEPGDSGREKQ